MRRFLTVLFLAVCLSGCGDETGPENDIAIDLMVDLQPAADLGYDVTSVDVTVSGSFTYRRSDMMIDGNSATGSVGGLADGRYTVTVRVHAGEPVLASGTLSLTAGAGRLAFTAVDWESLFPDLPRNILFIGNSLTLANDGLAETFQAMAEDFDPHVTVACAMVARGGMSLMDHWTIANSNAVAQVESGDYDLVVLQPSPGNIIENTGDYAEAIENFTTLARENGSDVALLVPHTYTDALEEADTIVRRLDTVARDLALSKLPMNQTWEAWRAARPEVSLYTDAIHQTPLGTYLYLCVAYSGILQTSPQGLGYVNDPAIAEADRGQMQDLAWETTAPLRGWTVE